METENQEKEVNGKGNDIAVRNQVTLDMPSLSDFGKLNNMKMDYNLTARYRTMEDWSLYKDKEVKAFFLGVKQIPNDDGEMVSCAVFASENGVFLAAQMVLVEAVQHLSSKTPVMIIYRGKKANKNSKGSTNLFDVYTG